MIRKACLLHQHVGALAIAVAGALWAPGAPLRGEAPAHSIARQWNEELLAAIRKDSARPTVHARNLWHTSLAMWDSWAAYDSTSNTFIHHEYAQATDIPSARAETLSYACYRLLSHRFKNSPGAAVTLPSLNAKMATLGYDVNVITTVGNTPAALGNRITATIIAFGLADNSNEIDNYKNRFYAPINPPLVPGLPGNPNIIDPNRWQPLALSFFIDQAGNVVLGGYPAAFTQEWGQVPGFALTSADRTSSTRGGFDYWAYHDPGPPPALGGVGDDLYRWGFEMNLSWASHHTTEDGVMIDASPASIGNAVLPDPSDIPPFYDFEHGGDMGPGYAVNAVTGQPYESQMVPRGDFTRSLSEFWADGPNSETPPGHWFSVANYVSDHPLHVRRLGGTGPVLDPLEWDVKVYFVLGGAVHDAAVCAWGIKGRYDGIRPISAIRHLAGLGQRSDPGLPSYHPQGFNLRPGLIELVTPETTAPGQRHAHLAGSDDKIAVRVWRGPLLVADPKVNTAGVGWVLAENYWPYQVKTFVTPPFPGYISGHSTFSRAGATSLTLLTGSEFFPGGLGEFVCAQDSFLRVEKGPSVTVKLQWAKYFDAADQCSLSRIWTGFHPPWDDIPGRFIGKKAGEGSFALAQNYFAGTQRKRFHRGDVNDSGRLDLSDAVSTFGYLFLGGAKPGCLEAADSNNDGRVDISDGSHILGFLFLGTAPPVSPGPTTDACGTDPDAPGSAGDLGCESYASCNS